MFWCVSLGFLEFFFGFFELEGLGSSLAFFFLRLKRRVSSGVLLLVWGFFLWVF